MEQLKPRTYLSNADSQSLRKTLPSKTNPCCPGTAHVQVLHVR